MSIITRFAPSPSGMLHAGHAYSALRAWDFACEHGGQFILRIEDIDFNRCKPEFESLLKEDLAWLGIEWQEPVRRQSDHLQDFREAADRLEQMGLLYPCFCTRKEILAEIARSASAPHGSEGPIYPGTCRQLTEQQRRDKMASGTSYALRIDLAAALNQVGEPLVWQDLQHGKITINEAVWADLGDVILVRKDIQTSYHIAVVVDDALQEVSHIIRGQDLFESTHIHILLQRLLGYPQPIYLHHQLVNDAQGKRLAKRDESQTLASLRERGTTPEELRAMIF